MIKYILFDLDGTLTDPKEGITKCVSYALKAFGIEKDPEELLCFIGPPLKEQFMLYAKLTEEDAEKAVSIYRERFAPIGIFENKIYDGVNSLLKKLKDDGYVLAMATSKPYVFAEKIAEKYNIAPYMTLIEGSELDGRNTDKAAVIKNAMEKLGAEPHNTVMVGDREYDCIGAEKNSIPCVGVSYGYAKEGELEHSSAVKIAKTPQELYCILTQM